ncbi:hypothetical protein A0O34_19850 [Chryseobacterium glaciei]|uniref:Anaphase-promoting complex subunit 4 WD40 domain-containing protein n=1 Tax=Chryseobacterium glaciei TaxID=1685010 RepID=A0A172Y0N8_9FLAO|nr:hypothetical protein [Chryseobacterium glaciei]ANF52625.1 hypothetical protein A0O34_19850 [Chryseobacterium glaciei]
MNIKEHWRITLKNAIFGGIKPQVDPVDDTHFYISDGWGSSFPSMKLRKLVLEAGDEVNSISIKNSVRCLYWNENKKVLFAVSDNKIFQIDRASFTIEKKLTKGVPKYSDYISSDDKNALLLMNFSSNFLNIYNTDTETSIKKKMKSCRGISKVNDNSFLIFCGHYGSVMRYDLLKNETDQVLKTEIYKNVIHRKSGRLYLQCGILEPATETKHERIEPIPKLIIYQSLDHKTPFTINLDFHFSDFLVSEDEKLIYFYEDNRVWVYSLQDKMIKNHFEFEENIRIVQIFDKQKKIIGYPYDNEKMLICWKF